MKLQLLVLLILVSAPFLFASTEQPRYIEPQAVSHYEPVLNAQISEARDVIQWSAYARQWIFNVRPSNTFADEEGESVHFFGHLVDDASSFASFTWTDDYKTGMIFTSNNTFWLEAPFMDRPFDLVMFRTSDVLAEPDRKVADCSVSHHHDLRNMAVEHVEEEEQHQTGTRATLVGRAYLDNYWVSSAKNPSWYTTTATKGLLNDVNAIYSRYSLSTWTFTVTASPIKNSWTGSDQTSNMLNFFQNWANTNGENKKGNSLIWLVGNNVGGLAYVGSACGAYGNLYRVGVAGLANWSRLWTVKTIAHELGHNRGANHDFDKQCSSNQASGCQCSVMSYCFPSASTYGGAVNYFSTKSINEIKASCK